MNLLVGATGFIGGHLVEYLFQQGEISKGLFRKGAHLKIMDANGVQGMEGDLLDHHSLHESIEGVDVVYNLASPMPITDSDFLKFNTEGILNLLEASTEAKVKTLVHLGTLDQYGFGADGISASTRPQPSNEYQKAKAEAQRLLAEFSMRNALPRVVIITSARAIGPRDESLAIPLLRMIDSGKVRLPTTRPMSFSHPKDIAQAMYAGACSASPSGTSFLVKSFDSSPEELVRGIALALGTAVEVRREGLLSGSSLPKYTSEQLRAALRIESQPNWRELGYTPRYSQTSTCNEIAEWYRREPWALGSE